jgi:osmotically-inducible protein OsmY
METNDTMLQREVEDALKDSRLLRTTDIRIDTHNGEVTLYGLVDVLAEKWRAAEIVSKLPGVRAVDNSLTVAMDRPVDDKEIVSLVRERLAADPRVDLHRIAVRVEKGVVWMEGDAGTIAEAEAAKEQAAGVMGVKEVIINIKIGAGEFARDDATLANAVETAFSRSPRVSPRNIKTLIDSGIVTLEGTVDTADQIEEAVRMASQVPGVRKVIARLNARHGVTSEDAHLTNALRKLLGQQGLGSVRGFVVNGTAFLDGVVGTPDKKHRAEELAGQIPGIRGINNGIRIQQH